MNYHLARNNEQLGTFSLEEVQRGFGNGTYLATDLAWTAGMTDWKPLSTLPDFAPAAESSPVTILPPTRTGDIPVAGSIPSMTSSLPSGQAFPQSVSVGIMPTPGTAIASLVLGIISLVTCYFGILFAIPAVICGHMALKSIRESGNRLQGRGLAIAGLVMGYIWLGLCALVLVFIAIAAAIGAFNQ